MTNTPARVTIGLPVYNAEAHVSEALDSLLGQTYSNFTLVISDNASTDRTAAICRDYADRDPRIRYVRQNVNRGSTWNFNEVFKLSDCEYFKWAAYDDLCDPTYLARCVEVLDRRPEVAWVHTRSRHIDAQGQLLFGPTTAEISYVQLKSECGAQGDAPTRASELPSDRFRSVLLGRDGCLDSYGLIRSDALRKTGLYAPYFGSEKVLMAELGLYGRYFEIPETLFYARIHPNAIGMQRTGRLQRLVINPLARSSWQFPRLGMLRAYVSAIHRSEIGIGERARCYTALGRYLFQVHKWKRILLKAFNGGGMSGEYPSLPTTHSSAKACP